MNRFYDDKYVIDIILNNTSELDELLNDGNQDDIIKFCEKINQLEVDDFIKNIESKNLVYGKDKILCFSDYDMAAKIPKYLFFKEDATFEMIGKNLKNSESAMACRKYGENHSRLAENMHLVQVVKNPTLKVKVTNFGRLIAKNAFQNKDKLLLIILLSNPVVQKMAYDLSFGDICYLDYVSELEKSTKIRRRTSMKIVMNKLIEISDILKKRNINWEV